jgi:hypothetical protein
MAKKSGKPRALETDPELNEDNADPSRLAEPTLNDFLHEMHNTSVVDPEVVQVGGPEGSIPPSSEPSKYPSLGALNLAFKSKSAKIRHLNSLGMPNSEIAKMLQIKYQHVRNVLKQELKRGPNEDFTLSGGVSPRIKFKSVDTSTESVDESVESVEDSKDDE